MYRITFRTRGFVFLFALLVLGGFAKTYAQKMEADEIIAKHRASLGNTDAVANSKRRLAIGSSEFAIQTFGSGESDTKPMIQQRKSVGHAVFASNGTDMAFFSTFDLRDYRMERIGIFGNKVNIPIVDQGRRSPLGAFLAAYDKTINDRIFGGSVFSTWLFSGTENFGGTFETDGKKKVGNRDAWVVKYFPKGGLGSGSYIKLYFDAENFHHLRTEYRQKETERGNYDTGGRKSGTPTGGWENDMGSNGSTLIEDFDDFRDEAGVAVPHKYKINLNIDGINGTSQFKWDFTFSEYRLKYDFPADFFSFKA